MILIGDCREQLATLEAGSVHCVVTSPPYWGLRDYGVAGQIGQEPTPDAYVQTMVEVFREVRRVLHDSGTVWLNLGDSYAQSGGVQVDEIERAKDRERAKEKGYVGGMWGTSQARAGRASNTAVAGLKPKDLCLIPWRLAIALQADGWWVRSVICWAKKCLSGGTMLYAKTQNGVMPSTLKDLVRLDPKTVQLWDGQKWTQVIAWSKTTPDRHSRAMKQKARRAVRRLGLVPIPDGELEIELRSGERIGCTANHRWPTLNRGEVFAADLKTGDVLMKSVLPEPPNPVSPKMLPDRDTGWLCGFYLAEGCVSNGHLSFSIHAKEVEYFNRVRAAAVALDGSARLQQGRGNAAQIQVWCEPLTAILKQYIPGSSCYNKHLSNKCWPRSNEFLRGLLDGYLAGDGHARPDTEEWRLGFCKNDAMAADLRTLCARLGVSLRLKRVLHQCGDKKFPGWRGSIRFGNDRTQPDSQIVAIRSSRARCYWDITVESPPHLFSLASGIISHNSCMPEAVTDRPTNSWEPIFLLAKNAKYFYDAESVKEQSETPPHKPGNKLHKDKISGPNDRGGHSQWEESMDKTWGNGMRNQRNVWHLGPEPYAEAHFATFPSEIPKRAIMAGTSEKGCCPECREPWVRVVEKPKPPVDRYTNSAKPEDIRPAGGGGGMGGKLQAWYDENPTRTLGWKPGCACGLLLKSIPCTVLDPFFGSGTVGKVAEDLGRNWIGIELNPEYGKLAKNRTQQMGLKI